MKKIQITEQDINYMVKKAVRLISERDIMRRFSDGYEDYDGDDGTDDYDSENFQVNYTPDDAIKDAAKENPELLQMYEEEYDDIPSDFDITIKHSYRYAGPDPMAGGDDYDDYTADSEDVTACREEIENANISDELKQVLLSALEDIEQNPESYI